MAEKTVKKTAEKAKVPEKPVEANTFSAGQITSSSKYKAYRDFLASALDADAQYTTGEVDGLIKRYTEGKVK
jgi:hypothetical protein